MIGLAKLLALSGVLVAAAVGRDPPPAAEAALPPRGARQGSKIESHVRAFSVQ